MNITDLKDCPKEYKDLDKKFEGLFSGMHINYFLDGMITMGVFGFDVIKFDEWYKKYIDNYKEGVSLKESIEKKFGKEGMELIQKLINGEEQLKLYV